MMLFYIKFIIVIIFLIDSAFHQFLSFFTSNIPFIVSSIPFQFLSFCTALLNLSLSFLQFTFSEYQTFWLVCPLIQLESIVVPEYEIFQLLDWT